MSRGCLKIQKGSLQPAYQSRRPAMERVPTTQEINSIGHHPPSQSKDLDSASAAAACDTNLRPSGRVDTAECGLPCSHAPAAASADNGPEAGHRDPDQVARGAGSEAGLPQDSQQAHRPFHAEAGRGETHQTPSPLRALSHASAKGAVRLVKHFPCSAQTCCPCHLGLLLHR